MEVLYCVCFKALIDNVPRYVVLMEKQNFAHSTSAYLSTCGSIYVRLYV